jgi:hypothetical protein
MTLGDPQASKDAPSHGVPADQVVKQPAVQMRKQTVAEGLSPASVVPQQPSTPSEEASEPAGRSRRGSRQLDGTQSAEAQRPAGRVRAAKLLPQSAVTQPKASRPKPGRGRRPSADSQAAQPAARPQRARPSRASAVAAAGFLAKVITAEVDGKDVSGHCTRRLAGAHASACGVQAASHIPSDLLTDVLCVDAGFRRRGGPRVPGQLPARCQAQAGRGAAAKCRQRKHSGTACSLSVCSVALLTAVCDTLMFPVNGR